MKKTEPVVTLDADFGEHWRREREIAAKARAGTDTIKDYIALGYTEAGARSMVEPQSEPPESWLDEWCLWHHGKPPPAPPTFPPVPPFSVSESSTAYEWMMVWGDAEPHAPWFGPDEADARWRLMLVFAEEASLNLRAEIAAGAVPLVKRAFRRNRLGDTVLDITSCVISRETMLDFAKRIGGYGKKIAELLTARQLATQRPGPKAGATTPKATAVQSPAGYQVRGARTEQTLGTKRAKRRGNQTRRGPKPGETGFNAADSALFPEIEEMRKSGEARSVVAAALILVKKGKVASGGGSDENRAIRPARRYGRWKLTPPA
jgi:hypothetical protein